MANFSSDYNYHGLVTQVKTTMTDGFQVEASYTWAKAIDTSSSSAASDQYRNSISTLSPYCVPCRRGLSDTDIRHNFTMNYVWKVPTPASFNAPEKLLLADWELSGFLALETGTPFTVLIPGDPLGENNGDPYQYPDRVYGKGCSNPVNAGNAAHYVKLECFAPPKYTTLLGNERRNSLTGPGEIEWDSSLSKTINMSKFYSSLKTQFRIDMFNVLNHANFTSPNDNRAIMDQFGNLNPVGGAITLTNTTSRQLQLSLKATF